jgi:WD40 repeat protein
VRISEAGIRHSDDVPQNAYGQMKYSACGNRLAVAVGYKDTVDVFDFDDETATITHVISIPMPDHVFGVEFSSDGNKIYISTYASATLYQFDLTSGIDSVILGTSTALSISPDTYGLQLASDGKIYVSKSQSRWLGAIMSPDIPGPSCNYVDTAVDLDPNVIGHTAGLCLPGFVQSFLRTVACQPVSVNEYEENEMRIYPNPTSGYFNIDVKPGTDIYVYSSNGMLLETSTDQNGIFRFGNSLKPGLFFIRASSNASDRIFKAIKY